MLGKISEPKVFYTGVVSVIGFMAYGLVKTVEGYNTMLAKSVPTEENTSTTATEISENGKPANEKKVTKQASEGEGQAEAE